MPAWENSKQSERATLKEPIYAIHALEVPRVRPSRQRHPRNDNRLGNVDDRYDGNAEYAGETEMDWNNQATQHDDAGNDLLECPAGHQWPAKRKD